MVLNKILQNSDLTREEIIYLLSLQDEGDIQKLYNRADEIREKYFGDEVHLRGIIDFSNHCSQNCLYCGLRQENIMLQRYRMTAEEIISTAKQITNLGIYTIVLQSGEDAIYDTDLVAYLIYTIKQKSNAAVTLSLGERGFDEYRTWKIAGADRYLLNYETSNPKLYSVYRLNHSLEERINHLNFLKSIGFQIGSGNIVGLPMQTIEDIADDILICKELNLDMASFNPFLPALNTPYKGKQSAGLKLTLKAMAVARIVLKNVHIPATIALTNLVDNGRILGLNAGANIVMPDYTPSPYREKNLIYADKESVIKSSKDSRTCLEVEIESIGRRISSSRGDSLKSAT